MKRYLGEGSRKTVYVARDSRLDRDVALAMIKTEGLDEPALARVHREAQAMARLGDHANVVTVYDIGDEDGRPFIVSQFMSGGSLAELLDRSGDTPLDRERAVTIAKDVARALAYAHDRNIVHRDVKPGNIWLAEDGSARLGDFGLAVALDRSRLTTENAMIGTVAYMPPEQATGREPDARADLYSLGCVLYEMLVGHPPFLGGDAVSVIGQHLNTPPVRPGWKNADVPPALERLVLDLLAKAPEDRPPSAAAVIERLDAALQDGVAPAADASPLRAARAAEGATTSTPYVGRAGELATIKHAIDRALGGAGSLVLVAGEPGIGKSRIADEATVYARLRGAQVVWGRCYETEAGLPYIPFIEALRAHIVTRSPEQLRSELGDGAGDVAKLVSEIRQVIPDIAPSAEGGEEQERYRLFESVTTFLLNAGHEQPLVLVLDDLHWADKPSLLLLQHLARRLATSRLLVMGTYRDVELDRRHPLSDTLAALRRERLYERVLLRGLAVDEVRALLEATAQQEIGRRGAMLAHALHVQTEGNPFFIEEVLRHLSETGRLYRRDGAWSIDIENDGEDLGIPEGVREVIGRRLSRLSEPCNEVLTLASVLGREFDFEVLGEMTGATEDALLAAIEEGLSAQLIVEVPGRTRPTYAFSHALVRQTLYEELSLPRKQRAHVRAAQTIESVFADSLDRHIAEVAHHYRLAGIAGDPAKATAFSLRAAQTAAEVFAWEEAAVHVEAALDILGDDAPAEQRAALLEQLGVLKYVTGIDLHAALSHLERALTLYEGCGNERRAAKVHGRIGFLRSTFPEIMDIDAARRHLAAGEAVFVREQDTKALIHTYLGYSSAALWAAEITAGLEASERALEMAERFGDRTLWVNAATFRGWFLYNAGKIAEGTALMDRAVEVADELGLGFVGFVAGWVRVSASMWFGYDQRESGALARRELSKPRVAQAPNLVKSFRNVDSWSDVIGGNIEAARAVADEIRLIGYFLDGVIAMFDVRWDDAKRAFDEGVGGPAARGARTGALGRAVWLIWIAVYTDQWDEAIRTARWGLDECRATGNRMIEIIFGGTLAWLHAAQGMGEEARATLEEAESMMDPSEDWRGMRINTLRARAALAALEGDHRRSGELYLEMADLAVKVGWLWCGGATDGWYRAGLAFLEAGDDRRAAAALDEALAAYVAMGAPAFWTEPVLRAKARAQSLDEADTESSIALVAREASTERPAIGDDVTLLFTDIENSTVMAERMGDDAWVDLLREHNRLVRTCVASHGGREVKNRGDGFMLVFDDARAGVECALAIQRAFADDTAGVKVRIGLHAGRAIAEEGDFFGKTVITASRIADRARGGEILVSDAVRSRAPDGYRIERTDHLALKGLSGTHIVHALAWRP